MNLNLYTRVEIISKTDLYKNWIKMYFHSKTLNEDKEFLLILHEGVYVLNEEINGETLSEHGHFVKIK